MDKNKLINFAHNFEELLKYADSVEVTDKRVKVKITSIQYLRFDFKKFLENTDKKIAFFRNVYCQEGDVANEVYGNFNHEDFKKYLFLQDFNSMEALAQSKEIKNKKYCMADFVFGANGGPHTDIQHIKNIFYKRIIDDCDITIIVSIGI